MNLVGNPAPDFELQGYFKGDFLKYKLSEYKKNGLFFFFTPLISHLSVPPKCLTSRPGQGNLQN